MTAALPLQVLATENADDVSVTTAYFLKSRFEKPMNGSKFICFAHRTKQCMLWKYKNLRVLLFSFMLLNVQNSAGN